MGKGLYSGIMQRYPFVWHHTTEDVWEHRDRAPYIPSFSTGWRWVVSLTFHLYHWEKFQHLLHTGLGGPQSHSECGEVGRFTFQLSLPQKEPL